MASTISRSNMMRYINNRMIEIKTDIQSRMENCKKSKEEIRKEAEKLNSILQKHFLKAYKSLPADVKKYIKLNSDGYVRDIHIDEWHITHHCSKDAFVNQFKSPADLKEYQRLETLLHSIPAKHREIENKLIVGSADPSLVSEIEKILSTLK